jgi:ribosomal protein L37E
MNRLVCENCGYENYGSVYDGSEFKEQYAVSDRCYKTYAPCRRCNQHSVLLRTKYRKNNGVEDIVRRLQSK